MDSISDRDLSIIRNFLTMDNIIICKDNVISMIDEEFPKRNESEPTDRSDEQIVIDVRKIVKRYFTTNPNYDREVFTDRRIDSAQTANRSMEHIGMILLDFMKSIQYYKNLLDLCMVSTIKRLACFGKKCIKSVSWFNTSLSRLNIDINILRTIFRESMV